MGLGQADKDSFSYLLRREGDTGFERNIGMIPFPHCLRRHFPFNSSNSPPLKHITLMLRDTWGLGQTETQSSQDRHHGDSKNMILSSDSYQEKNNSSG